MREHNRGNPTVAARWRMKAKEIALEMNDARFLDMPEFGRLPKVLLPGERVIAITSGTMHAATSLIALTNRRIVMLDTRITFVGADSLVAVPVLKEVAIGLSEASGRLVGHIGITHGSIVVDDGTTTWRFRGIPNTTVKRFLEKLDQATASLSCSAKAEESPSQADEQSRIEFLDKLRSQGLISDDEYVDLQKPRQ